MTTTEIMTEAHNVRSSLTKLHKEQGRVYLLKAENAMFKSSKEDGTGQS